MKLLSQFKGTKIAIFPLYDAESTNVAEGFMHTGMCLLPKQGFARVTGNAREAAFVGQPLTESCFSMVLEGPELIIVPNGFFQFIVEVP